MKHTIAASLLLAACNTSGRGMEPLSPDAVPPSCSGTDTYPDGVVEPMSAGDVLYPYAWPQAKHRATGQTTDLDLGQVPCASDPDIDWSPFDVLLFVSIPAW